MFENPPERADQVDTWFNRRPISSSNAHNFPILIHPSGRLPMFRSIFATRNTFKPSTKFKTTNIETNFQKRSFFNFCVLVLLTMTFCPWFISIDSNDETGVWDASIISAFIIDFGLYWNYIVKLKGESPFFIRYGYIDVGDGYWRPNVLVTTLRCWWQFRAFCWPSSATLTWPSGTNIQNMSPTVSRKYHNVTNITATVKYESM